MGLKKPCLQSRTQWQLQMGPRRPAGHRQADPHRPGHQPFVFPCCEISTSHSSLLLCMAASSQTLSLRQMQCTCTHAWAEGSARRQPQSVDCLVHLSDANRVQVVVDHVVMNQLLRSLFLSPYKEVHCSNDPVSARSN